MTELRGVGTSMRVSVCMATFNGQRFVGEQLRSILSELGPEDEVVIVDDASTDNTLKIVRSFADIRVRVISQTVNRGYVRTFEHAMELATGDAIFLADQDDVWVPGRREALLRGLSSHAAVASNLVILGTGAPLPSPVTGKPWRLPPPESSRPLRNSLRVLAGVQPYYGCAMAIRRDLVDVVLPFPQYLVESHDLWIALVANAAGEMLHVQEVTIERRLHDSNASPSRPRGIVAVLRARWMLGNALLDARRRIKARS